MRVDLTGQPTEPVTQEHQAAARAPRPYQAAKPGQLDTTPMDLTLDLWEGLKPMPIRPYGREGAASGNKF